MTSIEVCGQHNSVAGRDYTHIENLHLVQRCEFAERLLARRLDVTRSEPCAVCTWTCAMSASTCPCCGADMKVERTRKFLHSAGRWMPAMTVAALLLAAVATFFVGIGLLRAQAGLSVGTALSTAAAPVVAVASLGWLAVMWSLHWRHLKVC